MINRLQSLELQGYKTFASSTFFEFPGQITTIVGPNGSGKSNIADAVRWVLGEQAYSLLRGKKTEDMIFSGSEQRSRASMALVSIAFNNQSGWLPIDFSEVVITRRAYRSGENEYLLNNQRVRLKEINELLGNSGLGERNYTIIGQGLIDNALSLKPDERRKFIEEAAGIDLYRSRRDEAIQKLDKTLRNMERVTDILGELKPRINSLIRSKEKSSQHKKIQNDLTMLLREWYGFHWYQAQEEFKGAQDFFIQQKLKFDRAKESKEKLEEHLNQIQGNLHQNRAELANLHKQISNYHLEIEEITRNTAVLEEREKTLKHRISELENERENASVYKDENLKNLLELEKATQKFQHDLDSATSELNSAERKISLQIKEQKLKETEISIVRKTIVECDSKILELKAQKRNVIREIEQKQGDIDQINQYIKDTESEKAGIDLKKQGLENKIEEFKKHLTNKDDVFFKHESLVKKLQESLQSHIEEKLKIAEQLSKLSAELNYLKEAEEHLNGFSSGTVDILSAVKDKKIKGQVSSIIQHLNIPEKYEIAIASVLGETLEGIVLEEKQEAYDLLVFLEKNRIARTAIFTGRNGRDHQSNKPILKGNVVLAETILSGNSKISDLMRELLSSTIIVENRLQALEQYEQILPGWKLVTLIGEVFDSNGIITAGSGNRIQPIRRKREKIHLENEVQLLKEEICKLDQEMFDLKDQLDSNQNEVNNLSVEIKEIHESIQSAKFEIEKLNLENNQKIKIVNDEKTRKSNFEELITKLRYEVVSIDKTIDAKSEEINTLQPEINEDLIRSINTQIDEIRKEVLELSSRKAVAEELYSRQNEAFSQKQGILSEADERIAGLDERIMSQKTELKDTQSALKNLAERSSGLNLQLEAVHQHIVPLEDKVESIIGQQGKIIEDVDSSRREFAIIERHTMQSQLKIDKLRDQIDLLKQKIEEDFGLLSGNVGDGLSTDQPLLIDEIVASLPRKKSLREGFENDIVQKKSLIRRLGPVNPEAEREFNEVNDRYSFLAEQLQDLEKAEKDLREVVSELDELMQNKFLNTFTEVNTEFKEIFAQLFNGGSAKLMIEDDQHVLDGGIEIEAMLPGKRKQELALLSGGERSLAGVALIFALLKISPTPFCILDEVDAMLDESNVVKFGEMLRELSDSTQFIVITHNRNTVQLADILYGVTMGKDSVSQVISLKMDELTEEMVQ
ncbi:MAG TPA: chromosome segregation protein SMC [Pelolinea sp.]|nr:chromosome segregation protein SMC [Pelolinea sp.]